jgi:similar to spore coat protein
MNTQKITVSETNQIHELLTFKNICLSKSITMSPLVSDEELKSILREDIITTKQHIEELKSLMEKSNERR